MRGKINTIRRSYIRNYYYMVFQRITLDLLTTYCSSHIMTSFKTMDHGDMYLTFESKSKPKTKHH